MMRDGFRFRYALSPSLPWLPAALLAATSACSSEVSSQEPLCNAPYSDCGGVCVALRADRDNCGACGNACASDEECTAGSCEAREPDGGEGGGDGEGGEGGGDPMSCGQDRYMQRCDGVCVDTRVDPNHCGKCGQQCEPGRACAGALCLRACVEGLTECGDACVDLDADPQHCGRCGNACDPGQPCEAGSCACSTEPSEALESAVPLRVNGTTRGAEDSRLPSCSWSGAPDQTFLFTAPGTGTYFFDTFESDYDTTLAALSADTCAELACNDDDTGIQSLITLDLNEGESILLVVSGASGAEGDFILRVTQPAPPLCAPTVLEPVLSQTLTGTTEGRVDAVGSDCDGGSSPSPDDLYSFTAPEAGAYIFSASASDDVIVAVIEGGACHGDVLGCEDGEKQATLTKALEAGQTVLVAVSSPGTTLPSFTLDVFRTPPCPAEDLGSTVPQTVTGSNEGLRNVLTACYSTAIGGEATYSFTAPHDGVYMFDTEGSGVPVVMAVRRGTCSGELVACEDSADSPAQLTAPLRAGETAVIVLDTYGATGDYQLEISELPCPLLDLGSTAPQTVTGTTADLIDALEPHCGSFGGPEVTYRFTAPADGLYTFDTVGSTFDTIVDVRDGSCAGASLRCNDDADPAGDSDHSRVSVVLSADQTVVVSVDSESGSESGEFTLNVTQQEAPPCPLGDLGSTVPQSVTGNNEGYPDLTTPTCGRGVGGEATYGFVAPAEGYYLFDTEGSDIETVVSVRNATCGGTELACSNEGEDSRALVRLEADQAVVVNVDTNGAQGEYVLNVSEFDSSGTCVAPIDLGSAVPVNVTGTTRGRLAERETECDGEGPEVLYLFTAPEDGFYTIDTLGSDYDTVLGVFAGDCEGEELACNDDNPWEDESYPVASGVTVSLDAGQTILIQVDGYGGAGDYELNISR
ncbi:MXAN_6577-like cysteine-rich protein [Sorangium sp. So ce1335]|uniref:MXAN_6577-like cysteine-rich protein n=1 Tax=Sorangium sp. So ce1335 TaxID=3133335 RepID=UPI003F5DD22F